VTKAKPHEQSISKQIEKNYNQLIEEIGRILNKSVQKRKSPSNSDTKQGMKVLGIDPDDIDELVSLQELGSHIFDNHHRYSNPVWGFYCMGAISFNDCCECRESSHPERRFFSKGRTVIDDYFTLLVEEYDFKPPKSRSRSKARLASFAKREKSLLDRYFNESDDTISDLGRKAESTITFSDAAAEFREGAPKKVLVNDYDRDPKARQKCIDHYGLSCSICNFNFGQVFGQLGEGFIHVHHLRPISEIGEEYIVDPIEDLRPVCPNCHAMIHRRSPPLSIQEIRDLL
jgi:HNH endonuclease